MKKIILILFTVCQVLLTKEVFAFETQIIPETENKGDFVLGGGKTELELDPGQTAQSQITLTNRTGEESDFLVTVEDFQGSKNESDVSFDFLDKEKSMFSLRDYLKPEVMEFELKHGEQIKLPVTIEIPKNSRPGGLYGAVIISKKNSEELTEGKDVTSNIKIISRLAALFYIRVRGEVREEGSLKDFSSDKYFYERGPINLKIDFENRGNIHLKPSGRIDFFNILDEKVGEIGVESFFVLPESIRQKQVSYGKSLMIGKYRADLTLEDGYGNKKENRSVVFWVIPWKILLLIFVAIFALVVGVRYVGKKISFKIQIKKK
jgi:hypothetical protein